MKTLEACGFRLIWGAGSAVVAVHAPLFAGSDGLRQAADIFRMAADELDRQTDIDLEAAAAVILESHGQDRRR